jgi:hypothetical protein
MSQNTTIDSIKELKDLNEYINDSDLEDALNTLIKLISKPDVPHSLLGPMIVQLQAISGKLKMMASVETHLYKKDRARKNLLYTVSDVIDSLVQALKYLVK